MFRKTAFLLILVFVLGACSTPAVQQSTAVPTMPPAALPTRAPQPTQPLAVTSAAQPTQPAVQTPAPATGLVTFKIVPAESQVTYEVGETFLNQSNRYNLAIGITKQVSGEIYADKTTPAKTKMGVITVDVGQFKSDETRRDNAIKNNWLQSGKFPLAKFTPTQIDGLPAAYVDGQEYTFKISGDLLVRETSQPVVFDVTVSLTGDTLKGKAVTTISLSQFGVGPISILGILNTEDAAKLTLTFVARP